MDTLDAAFAFQVKEIGILPLVTDTWMRTPEDRLRLAKEVFEFGKVR